MLFYAILGVESAESALRFAKVVVIIMPSNTSRPVNGYPLNEDRRMKIINPAQVNGINYQLQVITYI